MAYQTFKTELLVAYACAFCLVQLILSSVALKLRVATKVGGAGSCRFGRALATWFFVFVYFFTKQLGWLDHQREEKVEDGDWT